MSGIRNANIRQMGNIVHRTLSPAALTLMSLERHVSAIPVVGLSDEQGR
jgi:hypothetical protein